MTVNTYAAYDAACHRISKKSHNAADEALVAFYEVGVKAVAENKRLLLLAEDRKTMLDEAQASVRMLTNRLDILESRNRPGVSLEAMLTSQACEKGVLGS